LNVLGAGGVRQTEIHTAEPFVPEPSAFEFEVTTGNLKRCKSPGSDQIQAERETLHSEIHELPVKYDVLSVTTHNYILHHY
jgi:hypothetical protein